LLLDSVEETEVCHYRYGFFTVVAFLIPPLRWLATRQFRAELVHQANRKRWSRIDIVAHSFGTHLVGWGLLRLPEARRPKIHTLIFAGSVLKTTYPVRELGRCVHRLANDCGIKDNVLLLNQLLVLFTGMAGRVGFVGMEGEHFRNRYFNFGHGGYFKQSESGSSDFMRESWLPLLASDSSIVPHDERKTNFMYDVTALILNNAEPIKIAVYVLPLIFALTYLNNLRLTAAHEAVVALSRQLAAEAELVRTNTLDPEPAALLAAESLERSAEGDVNMERTLRDAARLLPRGSLRVKHLGPPVVEFCPGDRHVASVGQLGESLVWDAATGKAVLNAELAGDHHPAFHGSVAMFSPDGRYIVSALSDMLSNTMSLVEVESGKQIWHIDPKDWVNALAFSQDGRYIATGPMNNGARVFEASTGAEISHAARIAEPPDPGVAAAIKKAFEGFPIPIRHAPTRSKIRYHNEDDEIWAVALSPDGHLLATGGNDNTARMFDGIKGSQLWSVKESRKVSAIAFSPDGREVATGDEDTARVVLTVDGKEVSRLTHQGRINAIRFSRDGRYVATASGDNTARVFEAETGREVSRLTHEAPVNAIAFSPDGAYVGTGSDDQTARVFEAASGKEISRLKEQGPVMSVAFSPDDAGLATAGADGTISVLRFANGGLRLTELEQADAAAFSTDGRFLATGTRGHHIDRALYGIEVGEFNGTGRVFDAVSGRQISGWNQPDQIVAPAFSPDGRYLATGGNPHHIDSHQDSAIRVFETSTGKQLWSATQQGDVVAVAFSANGRIVAAAKPTHLDGLSEGESGVIRMFEAETGKETRNIAQGYAVEAVALSPNGRFLAVAGRYDGVILYDAVTGNKRWQLAQDRSVNVIRFNPNGQIVAAGSGSVLWICQAVSGKLKWSRTLEGKVAAVAFSSDGKFVAASDDRAVRVFEADTGKELHYLPVVDQVRELYLGDDQLSIVSAIDVDERSDRRSFLLSHYSLTSNDLLHDACSRLTRNLTEDEWQRYVGAEIPYHRTCPNLP
jgi:WD40 repeat protein